MYDELGQVFYAKLKKKLQVGTVVEIFSTHLKNP